MAGVLVIGGGIAGLSAAYDVARAGVPVTLVEASDRLGGKLRTDRVDGFLIESGPDSFVSYRPAAAQLATELGLGDTLISPTEPRLVNIRRDGRMIPMPDGMGLLLPTRFAPFARTDLLTWRQKLRAAADVVLPRSLGPDDVSIGSFVERRLGPAMVERIGDPLLGGVYGASTRELSLDAVVPQFRAYEDEHRSLLVASLRQGRAARAAAKGRGEAAAAPPSPFRSLRTGMGSLVDALAASLRANSNADVRLGVQVARLERATGRTTARLSDGATFAADAVIFAAPARVTAGLVADDLPNAAAAIRSVPHGSTAVVSLGYDADAFAEPLVGHGFLDAGPDRSCFSGCTFSSRKWAGRAPEGAELLRVFVPDRSATLAARPDAEVFAVVERDLGAALGMRKPPVVRRIARYRDAMPKYTVGHLDRVAAAQQALADTPDWLLAGATFRGVGVPECVASGRTAAAEALVGLG